MPQCRRIPQAPKVHRARQGIDVATLAKGDIKKKQRRKPEDDRDMSAGELQLGVQVSDSDSDSGCIFFQLISCAYMLFTALIWNPIKRPTCDTCALIIFTANKCTRCRSAYVCSFSVCFEKESAYILVQVGVHRGKRKHESASECVRRLTPVRTRFLRGCKGTVPVI